MRLISLLLYSLSFDLCLIYIYVFNFINLLNNFLEALSHSDIIFFRAFKIFNPILISQILSSFLCNLSLNWINFVSNKNFSSFWFCIHLNLFHPICCILKWLFISNIKYNNDTVSFSIVLLGNCSKSFLSCCIPYLYLNFLIIIFCKINF